MTAPIPLVIQGIGDIGKAAAAYFAAMPDRYQVVGAIDNNMALAGTRLDVPGLSDIVIEITADESLERLKAGYPGLVAVNTTVSDLEPAHAAG